MPFSSSLSPRLDGLHIVGHAPTVRVGPIALPPAASIVLQSIVSRETPVDDGFIVKAIEPAWRRIADLISQDPQALFSMTPEQLEELVAASYDRAGFDEVILTPRSGDLGRDVIATKRGWGSVRILDQVKCYKPGHLVTANDVRAPLGVLYSDHAATKGIVTTSSAFAPRIQEDPLIAPHVPYRLELVDGEALTKRLAALAPE